MEGKLLDEVNEMRALAKLEKKKFVITIGKTVIASKHNLNNWVVEYVLRNAKCDSIKVKQTESSIIVRLNYEKLCENK